MTKIDEEIAARSASIREIVESSTSDAERVSRYHQFLVAEAAEISTFGAKLGLAPIGIPE